MAKKRPHGDGSLIQIFKPKDPVTGEKKLRSPYYYAQFYDANGKQVRVNTERTVKAEALVELRRLMRDRDNGAPDPNEARRVTYKDLRAGLLASYLERGNRSLTTRADGEETIVGLKQLDDFFDFSETNPGPAVGDITVDTARDFVKKRKAEGAGNAVINRSLSCLRRMLKIAHEDRKIMNVPVIRLQKEPPARRGFVTDQKFGELLKALPSILRPLIAFLFFCGVRLGEALAIEWSQVDFSAGLIRLHETKTDEPRVVPLPSILRMLLAEIEPKVGCVFVSTNLRKEWIAACAACGLGTKIEVEGKPYDPRYEGLTIHDLRRSAVRNLVRAGVAETVAMKISGHKTRSVFDRYAIASESDLRTAMSRVETNGLGETLVKLALPEKSKKSRKSATRAVVALSSRG
jgi:integrase